MKIEKFTQAASAKGVQISEVGAAVQIDHENMVNGETIGNATVTIKMSKSWVDARGGPSLVRVLREGDAGETEILDTTQAGEEGDSYVFTALSPNGLSLYSVATVKYVSPAEEAVPTSQQTSKGCPTGIILLAACALSFIAARKN